MHSGRNYKLSEFLWWTRRDIFGTFFLALIPTAIYEHTSLHWLAIPWVPVALICAAAAFIVGFNNNATYTRACEARQI